MANQVKETLSGCLGIIVIIFILGGLLTMCSGDEPEIIVSESQKTPSQRNTNTQTQKIREINITTETFETNLRDLGYSDSIGVGEINNAEYYKAPFGQESANITLWEGIDLSVFRKADTKNITQIWFEIDLHEDRLARRILAVKPKHEYEDFTRMIYFVDNVIEAIQPNLAKSERKKFTDRLWLNEKRYADIGQYADTGMVLGDVNYFLDVQIDSSFARFTIRPKY